MMNYNRTRSKQTGFVPYIRRSIPFEVSQTLKGYKLLTAYINEIYVRSTLLCKTCKSERSEFTKCSIHNTYVQCKKANEYRIIGRTIRGLLSDYSFLLSFIRKTKPEILDQFVSDLNNFYWAER